MNYWADGCSGDGKTFLLFFFKLSCYPILRPSLFKKKKKSLVCLNIYFTCLCFKLLFPFYSLFYCLFELWVTHCPSPILNLVLQTVTCGWSNNTPVVQPLISWLSCSGSELGVLCSTDLFFFNMLRQRQLLQLWCCCSYRVRNHSALLPVSQSLALCAALTPALPSQLQNCWLGWHQLIPSFLCCELCFIVVCQEQKLIPARLILSIYIYIYIHFIRTNKRSIEIPIDIFNHFPGCVSHQQTCIKQWAWNAICFCL